MKIAVWKTGHEIADTVADAIARGLIDNGKERLIAYATTDHVELASAYDINIGYGILRGMSEVYRASEQAGKPWFNIDKGYFKPGHYDGYYRVSLGGTQQTIGLDKLQPDYERLDALGVDVLPFSDRTGPQLYCPPTSYVAAFFPKSFMKINLPVIERMKDCDRPLQSDLDRCSSVVTFNSSVGWEALRQGIPVVSDPNHSIVGAYQQMLMDRGIPQSVDSRRELFGLMAGLQLTLDEMRQGKLWPLMGRLMSSSAGIAEKP